jgi:hypothetical protein
MTLSLTTWSTPAASAAAMSRSPISSWSGVTGVTRKTLSDALEDGRDLLLVAEVGDPHLGAVRLDGRGLVGGMDDGHGRHAALAQLRGHLRTYVPRGPDDQDLRFHVGTPWGFVEPRSVPALPTVRRRR